MTWCGKNKPGKIRLNGCRFAVIPAKAGIQVRKAATGCPGPPLSRGRRRPRGGNGKHMQKHVGWLWLVGFFGLLAAAGAQTSSSPSVSTEYDGAYAFVSATKVNETSRDFHNRERPCGNMGNATSLVIVNGQARYTTAKGHLVEGTVGRQGELAMRYPPDPDGRQGISPGRERPVVGRIDSNGTIRARQIGYRCSHDLTWQKEPK